MAPATVSNPKESSYEQIKKPQENGHNFVFNSCGEVGKECVQFGVTANQKYHL
jgi:hypothetical protein